MYQRFLCSKNKKINIYVLDKPSAKPIPGPATQVIGRIPHLQETQLQGTAHALGVHPLSMLLQEFIIWLKMLLFFEELKNRLWHKNKPFWGYRIKTQIYQVLLTNCLERLFVITVSILINTPSKIIDKSPILIM